MSILENSATSRGAAFLTRSDDQRFYVLLVQTMAVCTAFYLLFGADWRTLSIEWISRLLLLHFIWALWSWRKLAGTLLNPYMLFMLSATLFNAGLGLVEALHLNRNPILEEFPVEIATRSLLLVFASLTALHWGALFAQRYRPDDLGGQVESSPVGDRASRLVGVALIAISIVPLLTLLKDAISIGISAGYSALYEQGAATAGLDSAIRTLADLTGPGAFFVIAGSSKRHFERRAVLLLLVLHCGTSLFLGSRGSSMMLVAATYLWDRTIARLPRTLIIGATAVLLVGIFPFIRETRNLSAAERRTVSVRGTYSELEEHPAVDVVMEMGGSISTVAYTLELVPRHRSYDMGVEYLYAVFSIVPSLFWEYHPAVTHSVSGWLIQAVDPATAGAGSGLGFSFVAEAFFNFGALGVPLVSLLLGYGIVRFWIWAERTRDPRRFAVVAILLPYLLFFARGEFGFLPRPLVWYGLAPYGVYLYLRRVLDSRAP